MMKGISVLVLGGLVGAALMACEDEVAGGGEGASDAGASEVQAAAELDAGDAGAPDAPAPGEGEAPVGYEIMQVLSPTEIKAWAGLEPMTPEEFEAIELPAGWFKKQPREIEMDGGVFERSPDAAAPGEFDDQEHFGRMWRHVATVTGQTLMDEEGLLKAGKVRKFHTVTFNQGKTLTVLISPEGDHYVRITRDLNRTSDVPTIPGAWQTLEHVAPEALSFKLPDLTLVIRADNEDAFQGPVAELNLLE